MSKLRRLVLISTIILSGCWSCMTVVDFLCSKQAKEPIFAMPIEVTDCTMYKGLGYTITLRYSGAVGLHKEELKGYFSWGWK